MLLLVFFYLQVRILSALYNGTGSYDSTNYSSYIRGRAIRIISQPRVAGHKSSQLVGGVFTANGKTDTPDHNRNMYYRKQETRVQKDEMSYDKTRCVFERKSAGFCFWWQLYT